MVSAAPTSTTNITGFFSKVNGFSLAKDALAARPTISGSNNGRDRASFFGISEAGSLCGAFGAGFGSVIIVDIRRLRCGVRGVEAFLDVFDF